jgi:hypothetical protein
VQSIFDAPQEKTIYVIDEPSKVAYTSRWEDFHKVEDALAVHWSCIYVIV